MRELLFLGSPARRTGPKKAQAALEYYLLLLGVSLLVLIALSWASGFATRQKSVNQGVLTAVENITNATLQGLASSETAPANYSEDGSGASISIYDYSPYWSNQPAVLKVEILNFGPSAKRIGRLSISVQDSTGNAMPVSPENPVNFTVPLAYSESFVFAPNSTGTYEIGASLFDEYGNTLFDSEGHPLIAIKEVPVLG